MELQSLIYLFVGVSFTIYFGLALWTKSTSTKDFYIAKNSFNPVINGLSIAVDFMSAVTFVALIGIVVHLATDGTAYILGFTGGFVLLSLLVVPYLRKFGKFSISEFFATRYYSGFIKRLTIFIIILVSFIYISAQMKAIGIVFARIFQIDKDIALIIAIIIAFLYSLIGGIRQMNYTQIAQYIIILFAFLTPAFYLSYELVEVFLPQLALFSKTTFAFESGVQTIEKGTYLLHALNSALGDFGFSYTSSNNLFNIFTISLSLMLGVAVLPHILVKFISTPSVKASRESVFWAMVFIAILYSSIASIAALSKVNIYKNVQNVEYEEFINSNSKQNSGKWLKTWEDIKYVEFNDLNKNERIDVNPSNRNELSINSDVLTLINPEIANLPNWTIALILAGALAASLSTLTGLFIVISSHLPINKRGTKRKVLEKFLILSTIIFASYFYIPNLSIVNLVAISFGILASTIFPTLILGIYTKFITKTGANFGMIFALLFTLIYIIYFLYINPNENSYLFGISPFGIGVFGAILNTIIAIIVSKFTKKVPEEIIEFIDKLQNFKELEVKNSQNKESL